jgi:hypothetical protein
MSHAERRRHVRLKPIAELPARIVYVSDGPLHEALDVVDISAGGIAMAKPAHAALTVGNPVKLKITLGSEPEHLVEVTVRWVSSNSFGAEIVEPAPDAQASIRRYIGELLERGLSV